MLPARLAAPAYNHHLQTARPLQWYTSSGFRSHVRSDECLRVPLRDELQARCQRGQRRRKSYVRADLGLTWRASENLEFSIWGQNLIDGEHLETISTLYDDVAYEVSRGFYAQVTYRF